MNAELFLELHTLSGCADMFWAEGLVYVGLHNRARIATGDIYIFLFVFGVQFLQPIQ